MTYDAKWTEEPQIIEIAALKIDDELRPRLRLDDATLDEYIERMREDADRFPHADRFPPIRVIKSQAGLLLVDGWHRVKAARTIGFTKLYARVRPGQWSDAVEAAAAQNTRHGKPRTDADKHRAVEMMLALQEWREASDRLIAKHCAVGHHLVAKVRASLESGREPSLDNRLKTLEPVRDEPTRFQPPDLRRGADGKVYDVSRQGAAAERTRQRETDDRPPPPEPDAYGALAPRGGQPYHRDPWATRLPSPTNYVSVIAWLVDADASDSEKRRVADAAFGSIVSVAERLKHDETVKAWVAEHEREERA